MSGLNFVPGQTSGRTYGYFAPAPSNVVTPTSHPPAIPTPAPVSLVPIRANATLANPSGGQWIKTSPQAVQAFMADYGLGQYFNVNDPLLGTYDQLVAQYADKSAQANNPVRDNSTMMYAFLMAKQLAARKKVNGDCGTQTSLSIPTAVGVSKIGSSVVGGLATTSAGLSSLGIGALAPLTPVIALAGLALLPIGIFAALAAHHAAAVAAEQTTDCDTVNFFNSYTQTVIAAVKSNTIDWRQAKAYFDSILATAQTAWTKTSQSSPCNAGCMYTNAAKALHDLFVMLYGQPPVSTPVQAVPVATATVAPATPVPPSTTPAANASAVAVVQTAQASGPSPVNAQYSQPPGQQQGASALVPVVAVGAGLHFLGAF